MSPPELSSTAPVANMAIPSTSGEPSRPSPGSGGVGESVIRLMTRLSIEHQAVNLSQGFPNEAPPLPVRMALAKAVLSGVADSSSFPADEKAVEDFLRTMLQAGKEEGLQHGGSEGIDVLNQYSPPMGRPDLRRAIAKHYSELYDYEVDPDLCITVTLGATEAVASALRTVGRPGDKVVIFEPYHELYPSQCEVFYLKTEFVTLRENSKNGSWSFNDEDLEKALAGARILILNTPHNPTGKVFTKEELTTITDLCVKYGVYIITDEIYEHMTYGSSQGKHIVIPKTFPKVAKQTLVCNSVGKSASATGWRLGWCIMPSQLSADYRGVHDQLVVMAPHPMQYATLTYLNLPRTYFSETLPTRYVGRISKLAQSLRKSGFEVSVPEGAYYLFAKYRSVKLLGRMEPWDAAMYMVKEVGVACVPGSNFYGSDSAKTKEATEYLRFAACRSISDIEQACTILEERFGHDRS